MTSNKRSCHGSHSADVEDLYFFWNWSFCTLSRGPVEVPLVERAYDLLAFHVPTGGYVGAQMWAIRFSHKYFTTIPTTKDCESIAQSYDRLDVTNGYLRRNRWQYSVQLKGSNVCVFLYLHLCFPLWRTSRWGMEVGFSRLFEISLIDSQCHAFWYVRILHGLGQCVLCSWAGSTSTKRNRQLAGTKWWPTPSRSRSRRYLQVFHPL